MGVIKVVAFGKIKEILGADIEVDAKDTIELLGKLRKDYPSLSYLQFKIAVNNTIVSENSELRSNDMVALVPPYSGG